jgi:hypothetical protein
MLLCNPIFAACSCTGTRGVVPTYLEDPISLLIRQFPLLSYLYVLLRGTWSPVEGEACCSAEFRLFRIPVIVGQEVHAESTTDHFTRYAPDIFEYGISRYQNETRRLYGVLDRHLSENKFPYLRGEKCTVGGLAITSGCSLLKLMSN